MTKRKRLTRLQFLHRINEEAANLHHFQGQSLRFFQSPLPISYFNKVIDELTLLYQKNFMALEKITRDGKEGYYYILFPKHKTKRKLPYPIFEVSWMITGLLGLALARQALVIHRIPRGLEPEDSDEKLVGMVQEFLREADPEEVMNE